VQTSIYSWILKLKAHDVHAGDPKFRHYWGSCQLVADLLATRPTSPQQLSSQQVGNSRCNGIWETTWYNTHTTDFCSRQLVTELVRGNWCNGFWPYRGLQAEAWLTKLKPRRR